MLEYLDHLGSICQVKIAPGSECEKFPACAKMNITGGCCPTPDGIQLGCCSAI